METTRDLQGLFEMRWRGTGVQRMPSQGRVGPPTANVGNGRTPKSIRGSVSMSAIPRKQSTPSLHPQPASPTSLFPPSTQNGSTSNPSNQKHVNGSTSNINSKLRSTPSLPILPSTSPTSARQHACNDFYLKKTGCSRDSCPYSHSYIFQPEEWDELPARAKRTPCKLAKAAAKLGRDCPEGDECIWGHKCLFLAESCPHGKECWFLKCGLAHIGSLEEVDVEIARKGK
ncbi:hypothetical protein T439DRAFT_323127 [Meredithblackwellia eburnea MCA 4105]